LAVVRLVQEVMQDLRGPRAPAQLSPSEEAFVLQFTGMDTDLDVMADLARSDMGRTAEKVLRGEAIT